MFYICEPNFAVEVYYEVTDHVFYFYGRVDLL